MIAVKTTGGRIAVLDRVTGETTADFKNQTDGEGCSPIFSSCGRFLIDGSWEGVISVREIASRKVVFRQRFDNEMIQQISACGESLSWFSLNQPKVVNQCDPPAASYFLHWSGSIENPKPESPGPAFENVWGSAFSRDGGRVALFHGYPPDNLVVCDVKTKRVLWSRQAKDNGKFSAWSPRGNFLACVQDERVTIYHGGDGKVLSEHPLPFPWSVAFSSDGTKIAIGAAQGFVADFTANGLGRPNPVRQEKFNP